MVNYWTDVLRTSLNGGITWLDALYDQNFNFRINLLGAWTVVVLECLLTLCLLILLQMLLL